MNIGRTLAAVGRPVAYYPSIARAVGGVNAGVLLCQLLYWTGKGKHPESVYKASAELEEETGLTYREQLTARKKLRGLGVIRERYARLEHCTYFEIDFTRLDKLFRENQSRGGHRHNVTVANVTKRRSPRSHRDGRDGNNVTVEDRDPIDYSESLQRNPPSPLKKGELGFADKSEPAPPKSVSEEGRIREREERKRTLEEQARQLARGDVA